MTEQERKEFEAWVNGPDGDVITDPWALEKCWLAARRTQDAKVRELVEAMDEAGHYSWCWSAIHPTQDCNCPYTLAAQLKEQDDGQ